MVMQQNDSTQSRHCPACTASTLRQFHIVENTPVHSVINVTTREQALQFPRGRIALAFCETCGFITNTAFDESMLRYGPGYESTQTYSSTFNTFARQLATRMIERNNLHGVRVLEIGCGNGEFLDLVCELGGNSGTGFDPAFTREHSPVCGKPHIQIIQDFYSQRYASVAADFIYCRMTLEHIADVGRFISMIRATIGDRDTRVLFQVPDVRRILQDCAFEDIYYEHCSYFSAGSLGRLFEHCGFSVLDIDIDYNSQYIILTARPSSTRQSSAVPDDRHEIFALASSFSHRYDEKRALWQHIINSFQENRKRMILWGAGSKAVSFLTSVCPPDAVSYLVDINPHRQDTFLAGSGLHIVAPHTVSVSPPDAVIIMNSVYRDEIRTLLGQYGLAPHIYEL